jgi:polysaccharide export outer membrane protein
MRLTSLVVFAALVAGPAAAGPQSPAPAAPMPQAPAPPPVGETGSSAAPGVPPATGTTGTVGTTIGTVGTTTAPRTTPSRASLPDYRIGPGDKLRIEVYRDPQLSQSLQVRPDGKVTLPLVGDLQASGLAPTELRDQIATSLKEYVTNPVVTVIVTETVAPSVFVMGEVNSPGSIPMQGPLNVMQALAMAGGFRDFANTKNIRILRRGNTGVQTLFFNYKDAVKGEGETVMLAPGDTVIVP